MAGRAGRQGGRAGLGLQVSSAHDGRGLLRQRCAQGWGEEETSLANCSSLRWPALEGLHYAALLLPSMWTDFAALP